MANANTFGKIASALCLFASYIKSGESWSQSCEEANRGAHNALATIGKDHQEIMQINNDLRESLLAIKTLVVGDKTPHWKNDWATTHTRGRIADIVDAVVR